MDRRDREDGSHSRKRWLRVGRRVSVLLALAAIGSLFLYGIGTSRAAVGRVIELVSVSIFGTSGNAASSGVDVNVNANFVVFWSDATNLIPMDRSGFRDVFERNRLPHTTQRVSINSAGEPANAPSHAQGGAPSVSDSGLDVAFYSAATNLVANDTNGQTDVFLIQFLPTISNTTLVSVSSSGEQGNGPSLYPSISGDGRFVAFQSAATNLVPNDTNGMTDVFVRDVLNGTTERVCDTTQGNGFAINPAISADGTMVAFASSSTNLVPHDTNHRIDIFVCDRGTGTIDIVSINDQSELGNGDSILPAINEHGSVVAFKSSANNLVPNDLNNVVDVFARDRINMHTERISESFTGRDANDGSFPPSVDYSGRFVAFGSAATNLVPNDFNGVPSVFVRDRMQDLTLLVDVNERGEQANGGTPDIPPSISGDAKQIGFVSIASNLTPNDRNENLDVFITRNPFICEIDEDCPPGFECENGFCVVKGTPTPTATAGPGDCCQCLGPECQDPSSTGCPTDCDIVRQAACLDGMNCVTFTPSGGTPTPTPTASRNDCCACAGPSCQIPPVGEGCPADCDIVPQAVCINQTSCATFTPTPTAGPNDCCQCPDDHCEDPGNDGCPTQCDIVRSAACLDGFMCVTFTPSGGTPTPTPTPTPTVGSDDCCECPSDHCEAPGNDGCPTECEVIRRAVCIGGTACATFTPTPTAGPNDCCECPSNRCEDPGNDGCPTDCEIVRSAVCVGGTACATFTGTPTPSVTPTPTGQITTTFTPTGSATPSVSATPTGRGTVTATPTGGTATPTQTPAGSLDKDAGCHCQITSESANGPVHVPYWLAVPVALLILRRRHLR
jgi:Tol biopolymer transport system component